MDDALSRFAAVEAVTSSEMLKLVDSPQGQPDWIQDIEAFGIKGRRDDRNLHNGSIRHGIESG